MELQNVLQLLISNKSVFVFIDGPNGLHDLDELVVLSDGFKDFVEIIESFELFVVNFFQTVIGAKVACSVDCVGVVKLIKAILESLVRVLEVIGVFKVKEWFH